MPQHFIEPKFTHARRAANRTSVRLKRNTFGEVGLMGAELRERRADSR
jgi:hypothetical protein